MLSNCSFVVLSVYNIQEACCYMKKAMNKCGECAVAPLQHNCIQNISFQKAWHREDPEKLNQI